MPIDITRKLAVRIEMERILRETARAKSMVAPELSDSDLDALCADGRPSRHDLFRFAVAKIREARAT